MGISIGPLKRVGSTIGKIVIGLAVVSAIGGISVGPAFGEDNHRRQRQRAHRSPVYQSYGYQPYGVYRPYVYPSYSYFVPVPPPVVYVPPPPSLGFSLFFPIRIH